MTQNNSKPIEVLYGSGSLTTEDLKNLKSGDIIMLSEVAGNPLKIIIGGNLVGYGLPIMGEGGLVGVRIVSINSDGL